MASEAGTTAAQISREAQRYSLLQLVRWIKASYPEHQLRLQASLKRGLAYLEVEKAWLEESTWYIEVNWPGLYGGSSPLPAYITEQLLAVAEEPSQPARALLDLLNQRLYELLLTCLNKGYPAIRHLEWQDKRWFNQVFSLLGLQAHQMENLPEPAWLLANFQLLTCKQRSASGLNRLLEAYLPSCPLEVEQCSPRRVQVDTASHTRLGQANAELGTSAWMGHRINDRTGRLRLHLGPVSHSYYCEFINNKQQWKCLQTLIQVYLQTPVECRLVFHLEAPASHQDLGLGQNNWGHLGKNTWVMTQTTGTASQRLEAELPLIN
ncbi:type VI secretion system protein ImpH [Marinospirillum celere]|uniref:Type VI secretion system protein ImpH n=1 Tax=Marinospirillum celere TaxID=1122252 RepID=A0A1I1H5I8_9GAMM|nr:type VI secretion system baseplate subunit TssG [Marinospirillum celere]SFC18832.1 type VI secretion system protein ImpH [Marinospirillum celere]